MKPNEQVAAPLPRGGESPSAHARAPQRDPSGIRKIMSKKKGLKTRRFKIAHPNDPQGYVDQCGFVISWFKEMFKRVESGNRKSTREARGALIELLFLSVTELSALALDNKNSSAQWARRLLASIDVWIEKYRKRLGEAYEAHRRELSTVFRNDVWQPASPLYQALHRELWLCQFYRREIPWPKAQRYLPKIQTNGVPAEYDSIMKLPPLSLKSWKEWNKHAWPLFKKNNPQLLSELQKRYNRVEVRWSKYRKEFRQHLQTIAEAASG